MLILIDDGFATGRGTGIGNYTVELAKELSAPHYGVHVRLETHQQIQRIRPNALRRLVYWAWLNTGFQHHLRRVNPDVVHFTNFLVPTIRVSRSKIVTTLHDLSPWIASKTVSAWYRPYIRLATRLAVKYSDIIITVSDSVRQEINALWPECGHKIIVTYNFVPKIFWTLPRNDRLTAWIVSKYELRHRYALTVGSLSRRKNLATLLRAWRLVSERHDVELVIVGPPGDAFRDVRGHLVQRNVRWLGYVPLDDLVRIYDGASLLVFPSLYEGFGLPLLEAMTRGLPVVASDIPSSREVVADAGVFYSPPWSHEALAATIDCLLSDPDLCHHLGRLAKQRAAEFSPERVGRLHIDAYRKALNG